MFLVVVVKNEYSVIPQTVFKLILDFTLSISFFTLTGNGTQSAVGMYYSYNFPLRKLLNLNVKM